MGSVGIETTPSDVGLSGRRFHAFFEALIYFEVREQFLRPRPGSNERMTKSE